MEDKVEAVLVAEMEKTHLGKDVNLEEEEEPCSEKLIDDNVVAESNNENSESPAQEKGDGVNVVFSKESLLLTKDHQVSKLRKGKKPRSRASDLLEEEPGTRWKVKDDGKQERIEFGHMFKAAVGSHDWEHAESLIMLADQRTLNDALCMALDSIWFLTNRQEVYSITDLITKIVSSGARDFTRAVLRTSFLASCVSACRSKTMSPTDTADIMAQGLHERLQECNGDEKFKADASAKVQITEWALRCIWFHSQCQENMGRCGHSTVLEVHLQLSAFKFFIELAGNNLTGKVFIAAFDAACFPLTLFSSTFHPGWASGVPASAIQGLLGILVDGGADNVNHCFLEASRFGSTELVRMLLQVAQRNSVDMDVNLALGFASNYGNIGTMECLVDESHADAFLAPLLRAAERGCMHVVQWFVNRGCSDTELCVALTVAASSSQLEVTAYLLTHGPRPVLAALGIGILMTIGERSRGSLEGVAFLLRSDFLEDPSKTYAVADSISGEETTDVAPELRAFLKEHWSEAAFREGVRLGENHYINFMRVLVRGASGISLRDLPAPLVTAVAYLPLYRECVAAGAGKQLLPQRLRGELMVAARRLGNGTMDGCQGRDLLAVLEHHLPSFLIQTPSASK